MRNYLFTLWEVGGNVTPTLEAVRRMAAAGHRVRVMGEDCNRPEIEATGARFVPWTRALNRPDRSRANQINDWDAASPEEGLAVWFREVWCGRALGYAQDVMQELRHEPADLVVTSEMLFGVMAGCEALGQKFALLCVNISLSPIPGIPPLGPGLAPARTAEERALHAQIATGVQGLFDIGLPMLNEARVALGLPPLEHLMDQFKAAEAELLATSPAFDFPAESLPGRVRYVGPLIADPHWSKGWSEPWPAGDARPLVTVGFSTTFQNHAGVLQKVIDALAPLPVKVLMTLGGSIEAGALRPAGNTYVVESAPHTVVMAEAAVVVTHGGHGTVMRALVNRVPTLVIPHGRDQNDNAVRITERGAGLSVTATTGVEEIRAACVRLLTEPAFRTNARRLGDLVAADAQRCCVVEELERVAESLEAVAA
jgi:MGT family glycosyltransferase